MSFPIKSVAEIQALKKNWCADPIWDIEETEGFERYKEGLKEFRLSMEKKWHDDREARIAKEMEELCIYKRATYDYLKRLEYRIDLLEEKARRMFVL